MQKRVFILIACSLVTLSSSACRTASRPLDDEALDSEPRAPSADVLHRSAEAELYRTLDPPESLEARRRVSLWATHYSVHSAVEGATRVGHPLRDVKGRSLGVRLRKKDWCHAAMQGTVRVERRNGDIETFQFVRAVDKEQVDCRGIFPRHPSIGKSRFKKVRTAHLAGAKGARLIPFRSVAVGKSRFPNGTLLFVPAAVGTIVALPDGREWRHDGYFLAADRGGGLKRDQIDIFLGHSDRNPFKFARSNPAKRFAAYVVTDRSLVERMGLLHGMSAPVAEVSPARARPIRRAGADRRLALSENKPASKRAL